MSKEKEHKKPKKQRAPLEAPGESKFARLLGESNCNRGLPQYAKLEVLITLIMFVLVANGATFLLCITPLFPFQPPEIGIRGKRGCRR